MFAPVLTFQKLFEAEGVPVTDEEVRGPMGVHKRVSGFSGIFLSENSDCHSIQLRYMECEHLANSFNGVKIPAFHSHVVVDLFGNGGASRG